MTQSYMPNRDSDFLTWATNFSTYVAAHTAELPIDAQQATAITTDVNGFRTNLNGHTAARDASQSAREIKDEKRVMTEAAIRSVVRQFQASPDVTDAQREAMGIPVHSSVRAMAATVTLHRPTGTADTSKSFLHTIRYRDEMAVGKARPAGVMGCEVWIKIAAHTEPAPTNPGQFTCLGMNNASPFTHQLSNEDGGKTAHYLMRWVTTTGEKGPWSEILSATIVGM